MEQVNAKEFTNLKNKLQSKQNYTIGVATGCPSDGGLIERAYKGQRALWDHIGMGQFKVRYVLNPEL